MRNEAWSQFETAKRCRMTPATAVVAPSASRIRVPDGERTIVVVDDSILDQRPIAAGISACETIQSTPNNTPPRSVQNCCRPTQTRNRIDERVSGLPGSAKGEF